MYTYTSFFFISFKLLEGSARSLHTLILFEFYSEKHNSKIIKTGVQQLLAFWDKSVRQLQGDVCIQRRYSADLGCNQQLFDFLLPFDALFELYCIRALSWWHAIGWLAFCIQKQLDTRQDEDERFATISNALQPRWGKDLSLFPRGGWSFMTKWPRSRHR